MKKVKYFGHRGCRGLLPENTIASFKKAQEYNVSGIEWDVVVNKDNELIISHEAFMDSRYCLTPNGTQISKKDQQSHNLYKMTTKEIQAYDCGSKIHKDYPEQRKVKSIKPSVQEAFEQLNLENQTILFEIKSEEKDYGTFQPQPKEYAQIIVKEVLNFKFRNNIIFMCFDPTLLNELYNLLPDFRYVYLTYKPLKSNKTFLKDINFKPYALGMYHRTIRKREVQKSNKDGIQIFAWTVNSKPIQEKLIRYGVDGIITDYPDKIR